MIVLDIFQGHSKKDLTVSIKFDRNLLERVFSDAHVIDIDFSSWDKHISILVVSDHYEARSDRCSVLVIEFRNVRVFACSMPQPEMRLDEPERHLQWNVDDFEIQELNATIRLRLFGSPSSPILNVECEGIEIRPVSNRMLDETFPGWNRPFAGLVRQSIEDTAKKYFASKNQNKK
jgi:hypothetical protein